MMKPDPFPPPIRTPRPREAGVGLIEVMVAIVILSLGLLGLAGLQATGLKNNQSSYMRSQAVLQAYGIADRMRANRDAALKGDYDVALGASPGCSGICATDINEWKSDMSAALPSGEGSVSVNKGTATIVVQWNDSRATSGSSAAQVKVTTSI